MLSFHCRSLGGDASKKKYTVHASIKNINASKKTCINKKIKKRNKQRQEGKEGRKEGRYEARTEGRKEGRKQGRKEGRKQGSKEARKDGWKEERQQGRKEGSLSVALGFWWLLPLVFDGFCRWPACGAVLPAMASVVMYSTVC